MFKAVDSQWEAQRGAVDSLNSSLGTLAGAAGNRNMLNTAQQLAEQQYRQAITDANSVMGKFGVASPEYAAAIERDRAAMDEASRDIYMAARTTMLLVNDARRRLGLHVFPAPPG